VLRTYPSKALLFGEYTVILGSRALAVPLKQFFGSWSYHPEHNQSHHLLSLLYKYMADSAFEFRKYINLLHFKSELEAGLYFESNIPQGYGVGSSGALCAAIIDHFKLPDLDENNLVILQSIMAQVEAYFHGTSSGLDPMVSYQQKPIVVNGPGSISILNDSSFCNSLHIYLMDTGVPRKTELLVDMFLDFLKLKTFKLNLETEICPAVDLCIDQWINNDENVFSSIKLLSQLQYAHFHNFVPLKVMRIWSESLSNDNIAIKLCGAGGGGYFLIFAKNPVVEDIGLSLIKVEKA